MKSSSLSSNMQGTTKHELVELVGKKLKAISMFETDGDEGLQQFFLLTFTGGVQKVLACTGQVSVIEVEELEEILENSMPSDVEEDSNDEEYDEDVDDDDDDIADFRSELNFDDDD